MKSYSELLEIAEKVYSILDGLESHERSVILRQLTCYHEHLLSQELRRIPNTFSYFTTGGEIKANSPVEEYEASMESLRQWENPEDGQ